MAQKTRRHCHSCGKHSSEVGPISWGGNCRKCGHIRQAENIQGIHDKQGYAHKRRLRGMARYLERALLDDAKRTA
jgi:tRNA G26 N,N-dimethylase Trm1